MLVFSAQELAYLAVPKTGTTAVELTLRRKADIIFTKRRKHLPAKKFHKKIAPFLAAEFDIHPERIAVMRDPEEQIRSWFRYRTSAELRGSDRQTEGLSFDQFVLDVISENPPAHARIGSQFNFLTGSGGAVLVHRLFAYERQPLFRAFLEERFGEELSFGQKNVSPMVDAPLSPDVRARLRAARAEEFALYDRMMDAGGVLVSKIEA